MFKVSTQARIIYIVDPSGPVVIILAIGSEVRGLKSAGVEGFFQRVKILSMNSFGRESRAMGPVS